jgi:divalent metal cation (Fe/Co/Zn/Cd) transporter
LREVPEVESVRTHLEPLAEAAAAEEITFDAAMIEAIVRDELGEPSRELRFVRTDEGVVAFITLALGAGESLAEAHGRASVIEERVRGAEPGIADVVIHTEP